MNFLPNLFLLEGVAKSIDLRPLIPSPQPLSRRERGFCNTLFFDEVITGSLLV